MSNQKRGGEAGKDVRRRRKLAKSGAERPNPPSLTGNVRGNNSLTNTVIGKFHKHRGVDLHVGSRLYSPAHEIAKSIQSAMNPDSPENQVSEAVCSGELSGAGTTTLGRVLKITERGGVQVHAYNKDLWLKQKWVQDLGDGKLRISNDAYRKNKILAWAQREWKRSQ